MTDTTKVAELPELPKPDWKAKDGVSEGVYSATQMREFGMACYQAALARQEEYDAEAWLRHPMVQRPASRKGAVMPA